jgi:uncharacterized protein (DUF433 family)
MTAIHWQTYIHIDSDIRFGKPCIIGTRISVYDVLEWLAMDMSIDDIMADFPQLQRVHILACLAYAAQKERKLRYA